MISRVKQLKEALNERKSVVAESLQSLMEAEQKFEEKMKEVVKKLKEENDNYIKTVGKLKKIQPRLIKQPILQIDLNVEDTFDLQNLFGKKVHFLFLHNNSQSFGLDRFNQLKIALAPLVISILEPCYHE